MTNPKGPTTSVKHRDFVNESMGDKPVTALAGIGENYGEKLKGEGFDKAYIVLGQFLLLRKDQELFKDWLKEVAGVASNHAENCFLCLRDWCDQHL